MDIDATGSELKEQLRRPNEYVLQDDYPSHKELPPMAFKDLSDSSVVTSAVLMEMEGSSLLKAKLTGPKGVVIANNQWVQRFVRDGIDRKHCVAAQSVLKGPSLSLPVSTKKQKGCYRWLSEEETKLVPENQGELPPFAYMDLEDLRLVESAVLIVNENGRERVRLRSHDGQRVVVFNCWGENHINWQVDKDHHRETGRAVDWPAFTNDLNAINWKKAQLIKNKNGRVLCQMLDSREGNNKYLYVDPKYAFEYFKGNQRFLKDLKESLDKRKPVDVPIGRKNPLPSLASAPTPVDVIGKQVLPNPSSGSGTGFDSVESPSQAAVPSQESGKLMQFGGVCVQGNLPNCVAVAAALALALAAMKRPEWAGLSDLGKAILSRWNEDVSQGEFFRAMSNLAGQHNCIFLKGRAQLPHEGHLKCLVGDSFDPLDRNCEVHHVPIIVQFQEEDTSSMPHVYGMFDHWLLDGKDCSEPIPITRANLNKLCVGDYKAVLEYWCFYPKTPKEATPSVPAVNSKSCGSSSSKAPPAPATDAKSHCSSSSSSSHKQVLPFNPKKECQARMHGGAPGLSLSGSGSGCNTLALDRALPSSRYGQDRKHHNNRKRANKTWRFHKHKKRRTHQR